MKKEKNVNIEEKEVKKARVEKKTTQKEKNKKRSIPKSKIAKTKKENIFKRIGNWFKSVFKEMSKVKWISKKEMLKYSLATIIFVIFFALFFYAVEILMAALKALLI